MKKRHIVSPLLLLAIALGWNIVLRAKTPVATAHDLKQYTAPESSDSRHPIDVFQLGPEAGETENDVLTHVPTTIYLEDKVRFVVDPKWGLGTIVHVERALPITVKDGRKTLLLRTWANTVEEVLVDANRPLADLDKANYKRTDLVVPNMTIVVTRVAKSQLTVKETIPFETVEKQDPNLDRGVVKVLEAGSNGERTKVYEITREDGVERSRKLLRNDVTQPPKNKVVLKGTRVKIGKTATGKATWYDLCCKKVASNVFKKGTVIRITNLANGKQIEVTVDDTGAFGPEIIVDLHPSYFQQLGATLGQGIISRVKVEEILNP